MYKALVTDVPKFAQFITSMLSKKVIFFSISKNKINFFPHLIKLKMKIVPTTTTTTLTVPWSGLHRKQKRRRRNLKSSNKDRCGGLWSRSYRALFVSEPSSFFTQYTFKPSFKYHVQKSIAKSTHTPSSRRMKDINAGGIHLLRSGIKISFCRLACFKRTGLISTFSLNSNAKSQDTPPTTFASASKRV